MHRIRQEYPSQHLPFVVLTAASQQELNRVQTDFPQTPILRKPFNRQQLVEAIERALAIP
jgi:CheY-like chemotaxis protein